MTPQALDTPQTIDALSLAARGTPAAWAFVNHVQSAAADIPAALADGDWGTCVEACASTLRAVAYCRQVLGGYTGPPPEGALDLHLGLADDDVARLARSLPPSWRADRTSAQVCAERVHAAVTELEEDLPLRMPVIRTAEGFFPSVRIGADLERLRLRLGLQPIDWMTWTI